MKRVLSAIAAALILLISAGAVSAGAAEGDGLTFEITYTCSLDTASIPYDSVKEAVPNLMPLSELYKNSKVRVTANGEETEHPLTYKDGKGYANITLTYHANTSTDTVSITLVSPVERGIVIFSEDTQSVTYTKGNTTVSVNQALNWSDGMISVYKSADTTNRLEELYDKITGIGESDKGQKLVDKAKSIAQKLSKFSITLGMLFGDDLFDTYRVNDIIRGIYDIVYPIAFLVMTLVWVISVGKSYVSTDLWNKDGFIRPLLRIVWGMVIMTLSMPLLELIYSVFHELSSTAAVRISLGSIADGSFLVSIEQELEGCLDKSWLIGPVKTGLNLAGVAAKYVTSFLIDIIFGMIFYVMLAIRFIKLAAMQCISPFFFACSGSEKADRYLHSFLKEYIIYAAQLFIGLIIYGILSVMYTSLPADGLSGVLTILIYIAGMICVVGSGKFMRNLFS